MMAIAATPKNLFAHYADAVVYKLDRLIGIDNLLTDAGGVGEVIETARFAGGRASQNRPRNGVDPAYGRVERTSPPAGPAPASCRSAQVERVDMRLNIVDAQRGGALGTDRSPVRP